MKRAEVREIVFGVLDHLAHKLKTKAEDTLKKGKIKKNPIERIAYYERAGIYEELVSVLEEVRREYTDTYKLRRDNNCEESRAA